MIENVLKENEKLEVLVSEQDFPYIFIKPKDKFESFNIEIFLDKRYKNILSIKLFREDLFF